MKKLKKMDDKNNFIKSDLNYLLVCENCLYGKQSKKKFPSKAKRTNELSKIVHFDIVGPLPSSLEGSKYFLTFVDDISHFTYISFPKSKFETLNQFKIYKVLVENTTQKTIKILRSDNGSEYTSTAFKQFCKENGILHQYIIPYIPQQNEIAEKKNHTFMEVSKKYDASYQKGKSILGRGYGNFMLFTKYYSNKGCHKKDPLGNLVS
jgi:hypothetical protein